MVGVGGQERVEHPGGCDGERTHFAPSRKPMVCGAKDSADDPAVETLSRLAGSCPPRPAGRRWELRPPERPCLHPVLNPQPRPELHAGAAASCPVAARAFQARVRQAERHPRNPLSAAHRRCGTRTWSACPGRARRWSILNLLLGYGRHKPVVQLRNYLRDLNVPADFPSAGCRVSDRTRPGRHPVRDADAPRHRAGADHPLRLSRIRPRAKLADTYVDTTHARASTTPTPPSQAEHRTTFSTTPAAPVWATVFAPTRGLHRTPPAWGVREPSS